MTNEQVLRLIANSSKGKMTFFKVKKVAAFVIPKMVKFIYDNEDGLNIPGFGLLRITRIKPRKIFDPDTQQTYLTKGHIKAKFFLMYFLGDIVRRNIKD